MTNILALLVVAFLSANAAFAAVSANEIVLNDKSRAKDIDVHVVFPTAPGRYPVIVFSHGLGGSKDAYRELTNYWADAGYVCVQPTHDDSMQKMRQKFGRLSIMKTLHAGDDPHYWISRVDDMEAVLNNLDVVEKALPAGVAIDRQNIGVGGHSFGAFTSMVMAGARPYIDPSEKIAGHSGMCDLSDKRVKAFLLLSAQGVYATGLGLPNDKAWQNMTPPVMIMTGTKDGGMKGQDYHWRLEPYIYAPPGHKYLVLINGAEHMTFAGRNSNAAGGRPKMFVNMMERGVERRSDVPGLFPYVQEASLQFWNAYLKNDAAAAASLVHHQVAEESKGVVEQKEK